MRRYAWSVAASLDGLHKFGEFREFGAWKIPWITTSSLAGWRFDLGVLWLGVSMH